MKNLILLLVLLKVATRSAFRVEDKNASSKRIKRSDINMVLERLDSENEDEIRDEILKIRFDIKHSKLDNVVIENIKGTSISLSSLVDDSVEYRNRPKMVRSMKEKLKQISFLLYTKHNPLLPQKLLIDDKVSLKQSNFNPMLPVKIIIHAYQNHGQSGVCLRLRDAYLVNYDYNIIIVDWGYLASSYNYILVVVYATRIGSIVREFINFLKENDVPPKNIHLIGYDMGAHIAGLSQRDVNTKVGRITGLDPMRFGFIFGFFGRLTKESADFVDIIHTNAKVLGLEHALGHADFYPNGGTKQPGCSTFGFLCCHFRAVELYEESISTPFKATGCKNNVTTIMGDKTPPSARGMFCLNTNQIAPFFSRRGLKDVEQPHFLSFATSVLFNDFNWLISVCCILKFYIF